MFSAYGLELDLVLEVGGDVQLSGSSSDQMCSGKLQRSWVGLEGINTSITRPGDDHLVVREELQGYPWIDATSWYGEPVKPTVLVRNCEGSQGFELLAGPEDGLNALNLFFHALFDPSAMTVGTAVLPRGSAVRHSLQSAWLLKSPLKVALELWSLIWQDHLWQAKGDTQVRQKSSQVSLALGGPTA